ncbi:MAG: cobalt ECF transporter T component CbiQ [Planctomycetota bacterium]|nr:cobalt ECF transporter T component CbiQ [Planctomycetota bacterium]
MPILQQCLTWLRDFDHLADSRSTPLNRRQPAAVFLVAIAFLVTLMSFSRYQVAALLPLAIYPALLWGFSPLSLARLASFLLLVEPIIICLGILHPWLDTRPVTVAGFVFAQGWLVFLSLLVRGTLATSSVLLLTTTLGLDGLWRGLRQLRVPAWLVLQMALTYRYILVLLEETERILTAYRLRSGRRTGVRLGDWGSLAGGLFLRTYDRAGRVHQAMLLRGFATHNPSPVPPGTWVAQDYLYVLLWFAFFALVRTHDLPSWLGQSLERIFPW